MPSKKNELEYAIDSTNRVTKNNGISHPTTFYDAKSQRKWAIGLFDNFIRFSWLPARKTPSRRYSYQGATFRFRLLSAQYTEIST